MKNVFSVLVTMSACTIWLAACQQSHKGEETSRPAQESVTYTNPVMPGDFADPSVVRVGNDYWATATSSEWAPLYPILHSTNLVDWEIVSHVFPAEVPEWADAHFWAPEITYEDGTFYIYYTAKQEGGNLCVGVASATDPKGPYKDHGPLVCQEVGSIDGFPIRDDNGDLFLVWKEDGNSVGKPTPMWAQLMNEERTALLGEKFEMFRNDPDSWEGGLVEGAYIVQKNGYYYTFYSGDACCGQGCTYGVGVARAKDLRGPWEKYEKNPIMKQNEAWKCAGHGSVVTDTTGNYYFLYHAYSTDGTVFTGREGLLDPFTWGEDGWPQFAADAPSKEAEAPHQQNAPDSFTIKEEFDAAELATTWQWPVGQGVSYHLVPENNGQLIIEAAPERLGNLLAQRTIRADYTASTAIDVQKLNNGVEAGLTAIGDQSNAVGVAVTSKEIRFWSIKNNEKSILSTTALPVDEDEIHLQIKTKDGHQMEFAWSADGSTWNAFGENQPFDASYLPPWDRAIRIGLNVKGPKDAAATFNWFEMNAE